MKGFVKILEAIIACVILLTSLAFFFNTGVKETGWDDTMLQVRGEDAINALYKNGSIQEAILTGNSSKLNELVSSQNLSMFPPNIDYSLNVEGIPSPIIHVGCDCTTSQINDLKSILGSLIFSYKSRQLEIRIANQTINTTDADTDVLFIFGYQNFTSAKAKLDAFLENGGTIVVLGELTQQQVQDGVMNSTFGLNWTVSQPAGGYFDGVDNENRDTFRIAKYFANISGYATSEKFKFSSSSAVGVDSRSVVVAENGKISHVKINDGVVNGNGRTAWIDNYSRAVNDRDQQLLNNLTKAMIMWSSEKFTLNTEAPRIPLTRNIKSSVIIVDKNVTNNVDNDIYMVSLTIWRVFQ